MSQRPPAAINGRAAAARIAPVRPRGSLITALDIGSTKVCCFIARVEAAPRILGIGHQIARGVRGGAIVDLEGVGHSIRSAVHAAEEMAGEQIERVVVSLLPDRASSRLRSTWRDARSATRTCVRCWSAAIACAAPTTVR